MSTKCTEPSYRNESSDSVSRKPLDRIRNAFNIKQIFRVHKAFVTIIYLNSTIYSTILTNLSFSIYSSVFIVCPIEMRAAPKQAGEKGEDGQRIFPSFSSHGISASPGKTPFSCKIYRKSVKEGIQSFR